MASPAPFARCLEVDPYYLSALETADLPVRFRAGLTPEEALAYHRAFDRLRAGDPGGARTLLTGLAEGGRDDRGLCRATLALVQAVEGDHEAAVRSLAGAVALAPDCPEYRHLAGVLAVRRRDAAAAAARFAEAAALAPGFGPAQAALALLLALDGRWDEVEAPARRALAAGCEVGASLIAYSLWFSTLLQGKPAAEPFLIPAPRTVTAASAARMLARLPAVEAACPPRSGEAGPVLFVFCDTGYLVEHTLPLLWSLDEIGAVCAVHLHVANPAPGDAGVIGGAAAGLRRIRLSYAFEQVDLERLGPAGVYYSSARFCRFYQFIRDTGRPALMVDADSLFRRPPEALPGWDARDLDLALVENPAAPPWERFLGWATYGVPSPAGLEFLGWVAYFIAQNLLARSGRWFLDQTALFLAHRNQRPGLRLKTWDSMTGPIDVHHRDQAVLWTVTLNKTGDGPYTTLKRTLRQLRGPAPSWARSLRGD